MNAAEILESLMVVCFGCSWPMNVRKSYLARTTKGKSLGFLIMICIGYVCGIASKVISGSFKWYVMFFYVLNLCMVLADVCMYARNYKLDQMNKR